jgi:L-threonylcarbamoyladenylate synthase
MVLLPSAAFIAQCAEKLIDGQLIGLPTETVYGLAADASNKTAVEKIYSTKGRPADHPLIVHISSSACADFWVNPAAMTSLAWQQSQLLMKQFWPGPLTFILPRAVSAPAFACADQTTIGLRCPSHPVAQVLLQQFEALGGKGLAAPSANRFGKVSPTQASHVQDDLGHLCPLVLDGGACEWGIESTIVDLSRDVVRVLRPGSISAQQIADLLKVPVQGGDAQAPKVSGSLESHYAPATPIELVASQSLSFRATGAAQVGDPIGVLSFAPRPENLKLYANVQWIQAPLDPVQYAARLYGQLRGFDLMKLDRLLIELPPATSADFSIWDAVLDRLVRSAKPA